MVAAKVVSAFCKSCKKATGSVRDCTFGARLFYTLLPHSVFLWSLRISLREHQFLTLFKKFSFRSKQLILFFTVYSNSGFPNSRLTIHGQTNMSIIDI